MSKKRIIDKYNEFVVNSQQAESIGFEPMGQSLDHSLANCSFNHSGNSPLSLK